MAELYFKVKADLDKVVQLRNEIAKLKAEMAGLDRAADKGGFDKLVKKLNQSQREFDTLTAKAAKAGAALKTVDAGAGATANGFVGLSSKMAGLVSGAALAGFASQIVSVRGEFQQLEIAFTTLLQSKEKADKLMAQMVETAAKTPYDLQGVANGARSLLAYGLEADKVNDTLIRLGNVASGLGLPLERLTYLYGTTMVQGRLYSRDMLQFTSSGIPILKEMAAMMGKSTEEIQKMVSEGKIGFPEVEKVIERMTNKGGKFYNLMEEQSKSLTGQIANLKDSISIAFNEMGKETQGFASTAISVTSSLVKNYENVGKAVAALTLTIGTYKTAMIIASLAGATDVTVKSAQTAATIKATFAQLKLNAAALANPYVALAVAIGALSYVLIGYATQASASEMAQEQLNAVNKQAAADTAALSSETETLIGVIKDETSSTYDKLEALKRLQEIAPKTFSDLDIETIKRGDLAEMTKKQREELQQLAILQGDTKAKEALSLYNKMKGAWYISEADRGRAAELMGMDNTFANRRKFTTDKGVEGLGMFANSLTKQQAETKRDIAEQDKLSSMNEKQKIAYYKEQNEELKKQQKIISARKTSTDEENEYNKNQIRQLQSQINANNEKISGKGKPKPTGGGSVSKIPQEVVVELVKTEAIADSLRMEIAENIGKATTEMMVLVTDYEELDKLNANKDSFLDGLRTYNDSLLVEQKTFSEAVKNMANAVPNLIQALKDKAQAERELVNLKRIGASDEDIQKAQDKVDQYASKAEKAAAAIEAAFAIANQTMASVGDVMDSFGGDTRQLDNVTNLIGGIGSVGGGIAKMAAGDWVGGIKDAVKGIADIIVSINAISDTERQKNIEQMQEKVDNLQTAYDGLGVKIEKAYSKDASRMIEQQNVMIKQQQILIKQQIEQEKAKKKTDTEKIKEWEAQYENLNGLIDDNKDKAIDAILGEDIQSAIDNFAQAYMEAWDAGNDKAKASKDLVKNMIKNMITEALKMDMSIPMENIRKKLDAFWNDGNISASEEEELNKLMALATGAADQKYAWADRFMKDTQQQGAASKGSWETISSEQASELSGRFTAMQMGNQEIVNEAKRINLNTTDVLAAVRQGNNITDQMRMTNNTSQN